MVLERFATLVKQLSSTAGRLDKEAFLRDIRGDKEVEEILKFIFNPYVVTGISDKKLGKFKNAPATLFDLVGENFVTPPADFLDVLKYFAKNNTGRDEDIRYLVKIANFSPDPELVYGIIKRDLKLGVQNTTLNKVFGEGFVPKFDVMLAESYADNIEYVAGKRFVITEKLDGVRCVCVFSPAPAFFSRNGQPVLDLVELNDEVKHLDPKFAYDGELIIQKPITEKMPSDERYRATVKITNSDGQKSGLVYNIFDMVERDTFKRGIDRTECTDRKARLRDAINALHKQKLCPHLRAIPTDYVGNDIAEIAKWAKHYGDKGCEGIMLNIADASYECKRTKNLLKVKQFNTADVLVTDLEEGVGANRGKLGAVVVKFKWRGGEYTCRVGSGFKQSEREKFWAMPDLLLGKIIEIGYFEISQNQKDANYSLRFPTFKQIRLDKTEISMY